MLFSVLITAFNSERYIRDCINSVGCQAESDCEVIVVEDGSSDNTLRILNELSTAVKIQLIVNEQNRGQAYSLNRAFSESRGDYILFLDSDDLFHPTKLNHLRRYLINNFSVLVQHDLTEIDADGNGLGTSFGRNSSATGCTLYGGDVLDKILDKDSPYSWFFAPTSGLCMRRDAAMQIFPLPTEFKICADVPIAYGAAALGEVGLIDQPLGFYRLHSLSAYASQLKASEAAWAAEQFLNSLERYSLLLDMQRTGKFKSIEERTLPDFQDYERYWEFYYRVVHPCNAGGLTSLFARRFNELSAMKETDLWYFVSKLADDVVFFLRRGQLSIYRAAFYSRLSRLSWTSKTLLGVH